jgi:hypothetical protein
MLISELKTHAAQVAEYNRRVNHNTEELRRQSVTNSFDMMKFHGFDVTAGSVGKFLLAKKAHDILAALHLGALPFLKENSGTDAILLEKNIFIEIESKTSYTDVSKLFKTAKNTVYSTKRQYLTLDIIPKENVTLLKSCFNASYDITNNIATKGIDTYLLCADPRNDNIIDIFVIKAKVMAKYLSTRDITNSGKLCIKLSKFMSLGEKVESVIVPVIGYDVWVKSLLPELQTKLTIDTRR